jgi:hypothetical protein
LVSDRYELPFLQALCFHNLLRCPLVFSFAKQNQGIGSRFPKSGILGAPPRSLRLSVIFFFRFFRGVQMLRHSNLAAVFS